jgi:fluoroquinolone transport system ATP-binding protein
LIKVQDLSYRYEKAKASAVDLINFEIAQGEIFGFLGPSGAGKSTTQKILIGLLKGYQGEVTVLGKNLTDWGKNYYEKIGVSFELPSHFQKLTGVENLRFFGSLYGGELAEPIQLLDMVGLKDDAHKKVANYSKGMQMRLNFARSLLNKPQLLFLDEPTSGMDPGNARIIKDLILAEKEKGHTVFLTTHNMSIADELCDRVAFIVEGKIVLVDSPQKLKIEQGERVVAISYQQGDTNKTEEFDLEKLGENERFLNVIRKEKIQTIHTKESTLEDIFIRVTGRNLT